MSKEEIDKFIEVVLQVHSFYNELSTLSKKSSDGALNKFKLKFVNQTLIEVNLILGDRKPFADFDIFNEDEMPTNSDVTMILSQYLKSAAKIYIENTFLSSGIRYLSGSGNSTKPSTKVDRLFFLEAAYN